MITLYDGKVFLTRDNTIITHCHDGEGLRPSPDPSCARKETIAWSILQKHSTSGEEDRLKITFDALASHDITYVGIIQTAKASGLKEFPIPYVLTNCHNSLCAVGGTINEDDHVFGLSAAKKYGGIFVPPHLAVIHQYMRETMAGCGKMILGSDSHTRYGALGTLAIGEGGPELVKQLLGITYDLPYPEICLVYLHGEITPGVGPQDVALAIIGKIFPGGFVRNKVLEFRGPGIAGLSMDFRNGIDVMTTETACLSSIWETDDTVREYFRIHGRENEYMPLRPGSVACYDSMVDVDLSKVEPMIALPFHPSNVYSIREVITHARDIFPLIEKQARDLLGEAVSFSLTEKIREKGIQMDQGIIAGCAGGSFENIAAAADILGDDSPGDGFFSLSVYPQSQPVSYELYRQGVAGRLMKAGVILKTAFCGPCFGSGDVPQNQALSIRHTTRNFPSREGSKPGQGQIAGVALMDARSIAATAARGGILTPATETGYTEKPRPYVFQPEIYRKRVYNGYLNPGRGELKYGPGIRDWPSMDPLSEHLLLFAAAVIHDPVTTTDELIPSGETSSYRSDPVRLAEYTLARKDPLYVQRAKEAAQLEQKRKEGTLLECRGLRLHGVSIGSFLYAARPGDGSAREQAVSCQRVLGGRANIAMEYATKRYRSNLVNWGILPFTVSSPPDLTPGDLLQIPNIREALETGKQQVTAFLFREHEKTELILHLPCLTEEEREILLSGCLINHYMTCR